MLQNNSFLFCLVFDTVTGIKSSSHFLRYFFDFFSSFLCPLLVPLAALAFISNTNELLFPLMDQTQLSTLPHQFISSGVWSV